MWAGSFGQVAPVLLILGLGRASARINVDPSKVQLGCDSILRYAYPDLCDLEVTRGTILVRGLSLVYWRYRNKNGDSSKAPVLMVHGGPGFSHDYILNMKQQACRGREAVFYDQVGVGESSKPLHVELEAPWLFTIDYYNEEIKAIAKELKWTSFHFFGHSWGTIVGQSYGLLQDPRVLSIVLAGPLSDGQLYLKSQWDPRQGNLGSLPLHVQAVLHELEERKAYDSELYAAEDAILTSFFTTRTVPTPDCFLEGSPKSESAHKIYVQMQGESEFTVGGVLATMNFTPRLHEIRVPVLLTHGRYDTMRPPVVNAMYCSFPRAWRALYPRSGHVSMIDDPRLTNDVVGDFLDNAEAGTMEAFVIPVDAADPGEAPLTISLPSKPAATEGTSSASAGEAATRAATLTGTLLVGILAGVLGARIVPKAWSLAGMRGSLGERLNTQFPEHQLGNAS